MVALQILPARQELHAEPVQLAAEFPLPASKTGQALRRWSVAPLADLDRIIGERCAAASPGLPPVPRAVRLTCWGGNPTGA